MLVTRLLVICGVALLIWMLFPSVMAKGSEPAHTGLQIMAPVEPARMGLRSALARSNQWQDYAEQVDDVGLQGAALWMQWRLPALLKGKARQTRWIKLSDHRASDLQIWALDKRKRLIKSVSLDKTSTNFLSDPTVRIVSGMVSVQLPARTQTVVARMQGPHPMQFSPSLLTQSQADTLDVENWSRLTFLAGVAVAIFLAGLAISLLVRDLTFLAMAFWIGSAASVLAVDTGIGYQYIWPESPAWNAYSTAVSIAMFGSATLALFWCALDIKRHFHASVMLMYSALMVMTLAVTATMSLLAPPVTWFTAWVVMGAILILCICSSVWRLVKGGWLFLSPLTGSLLLSGALGGHFLQTVGAPLPEMVAAFSQYWLSDSIAITSLVLFATAVHRLNGPDRLRQFAQASLISTHRAATARLEDNVQARTFELEMANEMLSRASRIDGLTGVFNRRSFDESIQSTLINARDRGIGMAVIMIDLDYFKKLNDEYGHAAGDTCLIEAARLAAESVPEEDGIVARYGGEEFVALLRNTNRTYAHAMAEKIRTAIEQAQIDCGAETLSVTASLGVHCAIPTRQDTAARYLELADGALYEAKGNGRNQVVCADPTTHETISQKKEDQREPVPSL